jgi:hypothetical protein
VSADTPQHSGERGYVSEQLQGLLGFAFGDKAYITFRIDFGRTGYLAGITGGTFILALTSFSVNDDYAIRFSLSDRPLRAGVQTGWFLAMLTEERQKIHFQIWEFPNGTHLQRSNPKLQRFYFVLLLAGDGARMAANALVQVYNECILLTH